MNFTSVLGILENLETSITTESNDLPPVNTFLEIEIKTIAIFIPRR